MRRIILNFVLLLLVPAFVVAQGWERKFGSGIDHKGYYAQPTTDSGYIMAASSQNATYGFLDDLKIIKTNAAGDTSWTRTFNDVDANDGRIIQQTRDGGYIVVGTNVMSGGLLNLTKLKRDGSLEWRKTVASAWETINLAGIYAYSLQQTSDGGFIMAGELFYVGGGTSAAILVKTNSTGDLTWGRDFSISWRRRNAAKAVEQTPDGGYIFTGTSESGGFIIKTDVSGYQTWEKTLLDCSFTDIKLANNEAGYVLIGDRIAFTAATKSGAYFIKTNSNGDTLFTKYLGGRDSLQLRSIDPTNDGGYCISGYTNIGRSSNDVLLIKTNNRGDTTWTRTAGGAYDDFGYSALQTADGNYIIAGTATDLNGKTQAYLIKTDKLGNLLTNLVSGNIFEDKNNNCLPDITEMKLGNPAYWKVKLTPGDQYAVPDADGNYVLKVDTGSYQVNILNSHPYWQASCPSSSYAITFNKFYDTSFNKNFGFVSKVHCPLMWVDVATAIVRPCRQTIHTVRYCNNGTADANNVYIDFTLDPALGFVSSTVAPSSQSNGTLRFLVGTVKAGACSTIYVTTAVACTAQANSAICVKAKIYPDSVCTPVSPTWDKSDITVTGNCIGNGKIRFTILDTAKPGAGDMQAASKYRVYVDNAIVQTNNFQLKGGDSLLIQVDACGKTVRLEADQRPGHPGNSRPRATVAGCTGCGTAISSLAMKTAVAADDADAFVEEECSIVRASFDPNEKLVMPGGITENHYVSSKDELEYRINFQNVGNDTAFDVVLKDTIDLQVLDIASLQPGVASHPYTFRILGKGVLEWTFKNILLADSTTNERASHGFVKFKINQVAGLSNDRSIRNKAGIYFDFNSPVITNPAIVTVSDFVPNDGANYNIIIVKEASRDTSAAVIRILPHPLVTISTIKIQSAEISGSDELSLNLFDATGRKVRSLLFAGKQTELKKESLKSGIYLLQIKKGSKTIGTAKLVVK